jgi:predicted RNA binding protein YcfA (HicA-like mRNA interferase family)
MNKTMKYSELERQIKKTTNCRFYRNGSQHPIWRNPDTGEFFEMSFHGGKEVKPGTLKSIVKSSGVKL